MKETYQDFEPGYQNKDYLFDYFFHFNPYTGDWNAIPKDEKINYLNDFNLPNIIKSKSFSALLENLQKLITKDTNKNCNAGSSFDL